MRIRYTGDQATEHIGTGLWTPGETRDVPDDVAAGLVAGGGWEAAETLAPGHYEELAEAVTTVADRSKKARKGQEE